MTSPPGGRGGAEERFLDAVSPARSEGTEMTHHELPSRITARPDVFGGKPIVRDMRIPVELVLSPLAQGVTQEAILEDYPGLEPDDVRACAAYAHAVIAGDAPAAAAAAES